MSSLVVTLSPTQEVPDENELTRWICDGYLARVLEIILRFVNWFNLSGEIASIEGYGVFCCCLSIREFWEEFEWKEKLLNLTVLSYFGIAVEITEFKSVTAFSSCC